MKKREEEGIKERKTEEDVSESEEEKGERRNTRGREGVVCSSGERLSKDSSGY